MRDQTRPRAPEYQAIHGYSQNMDARLGIVQNEPNTLKSEGKKSQLSLASSLGTMERPEYPRRPNLAPATLQLVVRHKQPGITVEKKSQKKTYDQTRKTPTGSKKKPADKPYFTSDQYDPFAFQSTYRPTFKKQQVRENSVVSNRLDSRLFIQVRIKLLIRSLV